MSPEIVNGIFAIAGALLGALITGFFSIWSSRKARERKQVTLSYSNTSELLLVSKNYGKSYGDRLKIIFDDKEIETLLLSEIFVSNTGNRPIDNLSVDVTSKSAVQFISVEAIDQSTDLERDGASVVVSGDSITVQMDFLNEGEEVSLRVLSTGEEPAWKFSCRQLGLTVVMRERPVASYSDVSALVILEFYKRLGLHKFLRMTNPAYKKIVERVERALGTDA